jgi:hypothetical protein
VLTQQLGGTEGLGLDVMKLANSVNTIWNTTVIAISLLCQGGTARYFLNRRSDMTRHLDEAPAWAREVVQSIGKAHTLKVLRPEVGAYREMDLAIAPPKPRKN